MWGFSFGPSINYGRFTNYQLCRTLYNLGRLGKEDNKEHLRQEYCHVLAILIRESKSSFFWKEITSGLARDYSEICFVIPIHKEGYEKTFLSIGKQIQDSDGQGGEIAS